MSQYTQTKLILIPLFLVSIQTALLRNTSTNELENKITAHLDPSNPNHTIKDQLMLQRLNVENTTSDMFTNRNIPAVNACNKDSCSEPNYCISNKVCKCVGDFITYDLERKNDKFCNYKRKRQLTALLLEFLFPIGFGHFYSERMLCGMIKFIVYISIGSYGIVMLFKGLPRWNTIRKSSVDELLHYILAPLLIFVLGIWHIFDLYMFLSNKYYDGHGVSMVAFK
jgi:hypothetical protein